MGLVDAGALGLRRAPVLEDILRGLWRVPETSIVYRRDRQILRDPGDPSWQTLLSCVVIGYYE